ncbi:SIMPL domain-containing protein [uncultured Draconibacterium sp.]|uniref:SIMPL domain-containing protein n=1 Tax=uncultured Draconibacterium sp. TaxID=1573823 RepID=UPI0025E1E003|nr:SIMPL domain-containing protein [uncultured Draconibacterium sp.]
MKRIILSLAVVFFSLGSFAQNNQGGIITVEGKSSVKLAPEEISFTVNFSVKDENYKQCAEMSVEKMDEIKKLFIENGIDEELIKTNSFTIREVQKYDPQTRKSVFDGYEANIPVTIRTKKDYEKNDKIFELIKDNLQSNFNLSFALSEEQMESVKEKLIQLAVEDAKQKATVIAKSADVQLGKIKSIQYGEPRLIGLRNSNMELMRSETMPLLSASKADITSVLSPDEIEMRTNIVIAWEI